MSSVEPPEPILPSSAMAVRADTAVAPRRTLAELDAEDAVLVGAAFTNTPGGEAISLYVGIALSAVVWMVFGIVPGVLAVAGVVTGLSVFSKRRRHQSLMLDLGLSDDDARALALAVRRHRLDHMFGSNELPALHARGQRLIDTARDLRAKTP